VQDSAEEASMDMSVRHMEVLRAVLSQGGMTPAARQLGITQSAVSRIVQQVERQLGVKLFFKDGRNIAPTPEARELGERIEEVFYKVDTVRRLGRVLRNGGGRRIRIAVTPALSSAFLPGPLARMRRRFPETVIVIKMREMGSVESPTLEQEYDLSIAYNVFRSLDVVTYPLCEAPVACYLPEEHALAAKPFITPADLAEEDILSFNVGSRLGVPMEEAFASAGQKWRPSFQTGNSFVAVPLVRSGCGIGVADPFSFNPRSLDGIVVRPFRPTVHLKPQVYHRRNHALSEPEMFLVKELRAEAQAWSARFDEFLGILMAKHGARELAATA
jgi:DNA-binding transcriptional LysR family regulator